jgi:hypothetical protein
MQVVQHHSLSCLADYQARHANSKAHLHYSQAAIQVCELRLLLSQTKPQPLLRQLLLFFEERSGGFKGVVISVEKRSSISSLVEL